MLPAKHSPEELLAQLKQSNRDGLAWARKICANPSAYPHYSRELARAALGQREPGSDDEEH